MALPWRRSVSSRALPTRALPALLLALAACGSDPAGDAADAGLPVDAAPAPRDAALDAPADAGPEPDAAADAGFTPCAIELLVEHEAPYPSRLWAPVEHEGRSAALFLDTGSALTFLYLGADGPAFVERAGSIDTGCETVEVAGRAFASDGDVEGLPVVGILGADYLLGGTSALDLAGETLARWPRGATVPGTEGFAAAPFDDVQGHIIAPVVVEGEPVRLMVDTGSPHLLWLGQQGEPGDEEVQTTDAEGNLLTFYLGTALLEMGGEEPVEVPVLRAPSFPYFEETVRALGGDIHGLLGLSALDTRLVIVDPASSTLLLEPR